MEPIEFSLSHTASDSKNATDEEKVPENKEVYANLTLTKEQVLLFHFIFVVAKCIRYAKLY